MICAALKKRRQLRRPRQRKLKRKTRKERSRRAYLEEHFKLDILVDHCLTIAVTLLCIVGVIMITLLIKYYQSIFAIYSRFVSAAFNDVKLGIGPQQCIFNAAK